MTLLIGRRWMALVTVNGFGAGNLMTWSLGGGGTITQLREIVEETWNQSKVKTMKKKKIIFLVGFKIFCFVDFSLDAFCV
jgi:hypothetical protein